VVEVAGADPEMSENPDQVIQDGAIDPGTNVLVMAHCLQAQLPGHI
jgi:hypothetical protein